MTMKRNTLYLVAGILLMLSLFSCSKGGTTTEQQDGGDGPHVIIPNDITAPEINISTPVPGQVFRNGNVIAITGQLTDDYGLYRGTIRVTNDAGGTVLLNQPYEIHGFLHYDFSLNHTAAVTAPADYTVTVSFEDHGLNTTTKAVKIKVNP